MDNKKQPKISVIAAVYNVEKYLREAIDSVLSQTLDDIEVILIDDGSLDECPRIIDEYAKKDKRIIPVHKENAGYGSAMNRGLDLARGEYIAILEPDDFINRNMYFDLYKIAKKYDSDIVKSTFYVNIDIKGFKYPNEEKWDYGIPEDKSFTIKEYPEFLSCHPSIWSAIYKREFLEKNKIRFVEAKGSAWVDNPFQVQTLCLAQKINFIQKPYYYWRTRSLIPQEKTHYSVPFDRCDEIHKWLNENNIHDRAILRHLYMREFSYIGLMLCAPKIEDLNDCFRRMNDMMNRMDKDIAITAAIIPEIKEIYLDRRKMSFVRRKETIKRFIEKFFYKRNAGLYVVVSVFGHVFAKERKFQILRDEIFKLRREITRLKLAIEEKEC